MICTICAEVTMLFPVVASSVMADSTWRLSSSANAMTLAPVAKPPLPAAPGCAESNSGGRTSVASSASVDIMLPADVTPSRSMSSLSVTSRTVRRTDMAIRIRRRLERPVRRRRERHQTHEEADRGTACEHRRYRDRQPPTACDFSTWCPDCGPRATRRSRRQAGWTPPR